MTISTETRATTVNLYDARDATKAALEAVKEHFLNLAIADTLSPDLKSELTTVIQTLREAAAQLDAASLTWSRAELSIRCANR